MARRLTVAERYIRDVLAGKIVTSKLVRQAIERHQRDLVDGHERGLVFDRSAAQHPIDFFEQFLCFPEGELDGKPFVLEPFQQAKLWILYGWKWKDTGYRRYKYAYNEIGRGNCKSLESSGLGLYEFLAFGEAGPQVYSVATDKDTARLIFDSAVLMLKRSPYLAERVVCHKDNMHIPDTAAIFEPLAADADLQLGLRPSCFLFDELHVQPNADLWNVLTSAMGKRKNPLMYVSTNSGFDRNSVCYKQREYSVNVLNRMFDDDTWFAWICGLDEGDDPHDPKVWIKANPGLGVMVMPKELQEQSNRAKNDPTALSAFLRFRMSVWTESHSQWMPMEKWDICNGPIDEEDLAGRPCFGALDLSTTTDISFWGCLFPPHGDDKFWRILPRFFLPEESLQERVRRDRVPYDVWRRQGLFTLTPGRIIDYDAMRLQVQADAEKFDVQEITFDRYNSSDLVKNLENDGFVMVKWGQGMLDMNAPTKRLLELVLSNEFAHGGNPVLRWMANNTVCYLDPAGNIKPDKSRSREKIDGIVGTIMALGRGMQVGSMSRPYTEPRIGYL